MFIRYPRTVMANKENVYQDPYNMAKFDKQLFNQFVFFFFFVFFWHDTSLCTCILYLGVYCLCKVPESFSKSTDASCICTIKAQAKSLFKKQTGKKLLYSQSCRFVKGIFWHQTSSSSWKCSMSLYCVGKLSNRFSKRCCTS